MQKIVQHFRLLEGMEAEYKRRHDDIWPEMIKLMKTAGIKNYSIWHSCGDLFGYFEVEDFNRCCEILKSSEVKKRWDKYMADIISPVEEFNDIKLMFDFE